MTKKTKNTRGYISTSVRNRLVADSAGYCAIDMSPLVHENAIMTGVFAHIKAVGEGFARHDETMTEEETAAYENLIFICQKCHKMIDSDDCKDDYPVDRLVALKNAHKDKMSKLYTTFINVNDGVPYTKPTHTTYFLSKSGVNVNDESTKNEGEEIKSELNDYIDVLRKTPPYVRNFFYQMVCLSKGEKSVSRFEVEHNLSIGKVLFYEYQQMLEARGLCSYEEDNDEIELSVRIDTVDSEMTLEIAKIEKHGVNVLEESLINLDFSWAD